MGRESKQREVELVMSVAGAFSALAEAKIDESESESAVALANGIDRNVNSFVSATIEYLNQEVTGGFGFASRQKGEPF